MLTAATAIVLLDWLHAERVRMRVQPVERHEGMGQWGERSCTTCRHRHVDAYTAPCITCVRSDHFPDWTPG